MPLLWRIFKDGDDAKPIIERIAAQVSEDLPPGKYTIEAQLGLAVARGPAEVSSSEPTVIKVPMRAGTLKLTVPGQPSHAPLPEALLTLWRKENGAESTAAADSSPIWLGRGNDNELTVPEGTYLIRLESGLADPIQEVQVKAGEETRVGFDLSFGRLDLSASIAEGAPPISDVSFIVHEDDPDAPQGRREITRTAHPGPSFSLPSGTYYVTAKTSRNEVRQRIAIGKGDLVKKNIVVGLTRLDVNTVLENGSLPANTLVLHRVLSIEAEPKELARETGLDVSFQLASGRYRVETAIGSENVKVTSDVELQPGRDAKISARVQAARLTVKPSAAASADSVWEVRDQQGMLIARLKSAEGRTALLAPGRYSLRSASRDQRLDKFLELKAGETRTIELAAP
jgi:Ca-activated chloride channel family protein